MFLIYANGVQLGRSALEHGDPPMGVAFGDFIANPAFAAFRIDAPHRRESDDLRMFENLSLRTADDAPITCMSVSVLEVGQFDNPVGWEIECIGFERPSYEELFPHHVTAYKDACSETEFRYASGELAGLGDAVRIDSGATGVVVGIIHTGQYLGEHKKEHWDHYGRGVLVDSAVTGLIFYREADLFAELSKIA